LCKKKRKEKKRNNDLAISSSHDNDYLWVTD